MKTEKTEKTYLVSYELIDGAHFFTSADERVQGLCAASADPVAAFNEVTNQLKFLLGIDVGPAEPVEEFVAWLKRTADEATPTFAPAFAAKVAWQADGGRKAA